MVGRPVDALRSHVTEAQERAKQIVHEFEAMLLVTGTDSTRRVAEVQGTDDVAVISPDAQGAHAKASSVLQPLLTQSTIPSVPLPIGCITVSLQSFTTESAVPLQL